MASNKKYTHLFFDLDNTLWDFASNSRHAMKDTFDLLNLQKKDVLFEQFFETYSVYNTNLWMAYRNKEIKKKELTSQRFQLTFDALQITGVDAQFMNDCYLKEMPKQSFLIDGTLDVLNYLKLKRYRLFIITNGFREVQHKKLQSSGLAPFFEKVFISEEIKVPKPCRQIFEHAIKSANAKKTSSLMIGDDWDVDVLGAINFGIDAVHFANGADKQSKLLDNSVESHYMKQRISKLCALKEFL